MNGLTSKLLHFLLPELNIFQHQEIDSFCWQIPVLVSRQYLIPWHVRDEPKKEIPVPLILLYVNSCRGIQLNPPNEIREYLNEDLCCPEEEKQKQLYPEHQL